MQDMTTEICSNVTLTSDVIEVYDTRDNTIYHIGKLADNKCWLLDNLALDLTDSAILNNVTADNTNADATALGYLKGTTTRDPSADPTGNYATAGVANWTSSYSYSAPLVNMASKDITRADLINPNDTLIEADDWKFGGYYNYCAASIGTYCYSGSGVDTDSTSAIDVKNDICPAGWRMPTGGAISSTGTTAGGGEYQALYDAYPAISGGDNQYTRFRKAFRLPLSSYFLNGSPSDQGSSAYVWSSTFFNGYNMYYLYANTSSIGPQYGNGRNRGFSVRCVAK